MDLFVKSFDAEIMDVTPGSREIVAAISSDALDRDGDVVLPGGLAKKNYQGSPVLFNHDTKSPIGVANWVKHSGNRLLAKWRATDKTQQGRDAFELAKDGILTRYSVGFMPTEYGRPTAAEVKSNPTWQEAQRIFRKWELLEFSLVAVPANPDAVMIAISKGISMDSLAAMGFTVTKSGVKLNGACDAYARHLISAGHVDRNSAWSFDAADGNAIFGDGKDWTAYGRVHLGEDASSPPDTEAHWKYPVIKGGKVYLHALRAAESRAGQQGATAIEAAAKSLLMQAEGSKMYLPTVEEIAEEIAERLYKGISI